MRFVHLNVHSNYSFCRGASRLEDLVVAARRRGMDAMALTDTNGLYGLIWFLDAAKAAGLRPIIGAEIDLRALAQRAAFEVEAAGDPWQVPDGAPGRDGPSLSRPLAGPSREDSGGSIGGHPHAGRDPRGSWAPSEPTRERLAARGAWGRAVVLVKDGEGYAALCRLLSCLHHGGDWPPPEDPEEEREAARQQGVVDRVAGHPVRARAARAEPPAERENARGRRGPRLTRAWLAAALADLRGCVVLSADAGLLERIARLRRIGREDGEPDAATADLYVELRPGVARERLLRFSRASGIPPVATGGVHFVDGDAYPIHRLLRAIDLNTCLSRIPPEELAPREATLASPEEMGRRHPDCPDAVANAGRIADLCRFTLQRGTPIFPAYESAGTPELPAREGSRSGPSEERSHIGPGSNAGEARVSPGGKNEAPAASDAHDAGMFSTSPLPATGPDAILERDCFAGAERRYGELTEAVAERLEYELSIVREKSFAPYFLVVRDIVARAPRTCGRGSAAASLIAFALAITHVDPIRFDLFFERFLNPGRVDPPDIDVDFPWDERDDILDWVFRRYGRRRSAMVSNHVTFQARASVREIAKVYGLTDAEIGRVTKRMPWFTGDVVETTRSHPVFKDLAFPPPWPEILRLARRIDGYPRGLSVHCGGVLVVPDAIDRYAPVQPSAKGVDVVQWEKDQCEDAGLVKMDLLGNRSLAVIRDACRAVHEGGGPEIRFETFHPIDDPATQDLVRRGDTVGVFYVESPAMRQLQAKCGVGDFEHLVIHSSIIRPAANEYIREYVRRLRGGTWAPLHPVMSELLSETYGLMVYQEDVAKIAIAMAGFDAASADGLRKILSKKNKEERLRDYRERFVRGAKARGVPEETIAKVWDMILSFAGYSFCKPHSASYALVSFKAAYLRVHHPAEFMAAVISNGGGYYSAFAYVSECRRMGLRVLPPDINESERAYTGRTIHPGTARGDAAADAGAGAGAARGDTAANRGLPGAAGGDAAADAGPPGAARDLCDSPRARSSAGARGIVRVGLMQLKGFPDAAIDAILEERARGGRFDSFEDVLERCENGVGPAAIRTLIRAGAFDALLGERPAGLAADHWSPRTADGVANGSKEPRARGARPSVRGDLFWRLAAWETQRRAGHRERRHWARADGRDAMRSLLPPPDLGPLPKARGYDERTMLEQEIESLGFLISRHPLSLFQNAVERLRPVRGCDLAQHVGRVVRVVGWYVTAKTVTTRRGEPMEFLSFEDTTALYETTFFPRTYARFCHMMTKVKPYVLTGRVEEDFGAVSLNVSEVRFLEPQPAVDAGPGRADHVGGTSPRSEAWRGGS